MLLGYARVSTAEQAADDRTSLDVQEKIIRGFAMAKGFSQFDVAIYSDPGVSASIPMRHRPAGSRLLADAKKGDVVIASKLDRMFRSAGDACNMSAIFKEKGINLVLFDMGSEPVNSSAIGEFIFTALAAVAQLERTMIKERCTSGKKAKIAKGGYAGSGVPYGYKVIGQGREAYFAPVDEEQRTLEALKGMLAEGPSPGLGRLSERLFEAGYTSRTGKKFFKAQVSRMIKQVQDGLPFESGLRGAMPVEMQALPEDVRPGAEGVESVPAAATH